MKKVFCAVLLCLFSFAVCAEEFDPAACPDFSAKLFPGNNNHSVLLVTASGYGHRNIGFGHARIQTGGSPSKDRWRTTFYVAMKKGKKDELRFLAARTKSSMRDGNLFLLAVNDPWGPPKQVPLKISTAKHGIVVFTSYSDEKQQKISRQLKINLMDNIAFFVDKPERKLKIAWYPDYFVAQGLPKGNDRFEFDWATGRTFRKMENGITVIRYKIGTHWGIFPIYEKFYLTKVE